MTDEPIFLASEQDRPLRADAVQNRAEILAAAQRLFASEGVRNVTMSQISQEAGVGKGTLYRHFRSKSDLCHALLDKEQQELQNRVFQYLRASTNTPQELLLWFLEQLCNHTEQHLDLLYEATEENISLGQRELDHPANHWQWLTIVGLMRKMGLPGDIEYHADVVFALVQPRLYYLQRFVRHYSCERIKAGILCVAGSIIA